MKNTPNKKSVRDIIRDTMNNRLYMLKNYKMYVYVETIVNDLESEFKKLDKYENTKE